MAYNLILTNEALADIDEHIKYLSNIRVQLATDFLDEIDDVLLLIEANPKLFQV